MRMPFFGFELKKTPQELKQQKTLKSFIPPTNSDESSYEFASGTHFGHYLNVDGRGARDAPELIMRYRGASMHPEVDSAIEDIVNQAIVGNKATIYLDLDRVEELSIKMKSKINYEFTKICNMLRFSEEGHEMFRRWYIDGRLYHHLLVDEKNPKKGILDIRPIEATKIKKMKNTTRKKDPKTGVEIVTDVKEYYMYSETASYLPGQISGHTTNGVILTKDSVSCVTSGLLDETRKKVLSYLHKSLKPINQLRMMEDSLIIYRLARAPERRIFYIDVGNLPRPRAEEYMKNIMTRYRNKVIYDSQTGEVRDDRRHQSLLEDFWLPRREGGRGTEISTLPGGQNLGQIDDIYYFQKIVYRSLNVPVNRLEQEAQFSLGRSSEISRDEYKFQSFVQKLQNRFSQLFFNLLKVQLVLKNIMTETEWNNMSENIFIKYETDNHFTELKNSEILKERLTTLQMIEPYIAANDQKGFYDKIWVMKDVLKLHDEDIKKIQSLPSPVPPPEEQPPQGEPQQQENLMEIYDS